MFFPWDQPRFPVKIPVNRSPRAKFLQSMPWAKDWIPSPAICTRKPGKWPGDPSQQERKTDGFSRPQGGPDFFFWQGGIVQRKLWGSMWYLCLVMFWEYQPSWNIYFYDRCLMDTILWGGIDGHVKSSFSLDGRRYDRKPMTRFGLPVMILVTWWLRYVRILWMVEIHRNPALVVRWFIMVYPVPNVPIPFFTWVS